MSKLMYILAGWNVSETFVGTILSTLKDGTLSGVYSHKTHKSREIKVAEGNDYIYIIYIVLIIIIN